MKFKEKIRLMTILKVTKNQASTLSLGDIFFEKPQSGFFSKNHSVENGWIRNLRLILEIVTSQSV